MIDVFLGHAGRHGAGGRAAPVTSPLEKAISEIANVEYVYSTSQPSGGHDHRPLPGGDRSRPGGGAGPCQAGRAGARRCRRARCRRWWRRGASTTCRWWPTPCGRSSADALQIRQVAEELKAELTRHPRVAQVWVIGWPAARGSRDLRPRTTGLPPRLDPAGVPSALGPQLAAAGRHLLGRQRARPRWRSGSFFRSAEEVGNAVIGVYSGRPVYLREVATVERRSRRAGRVRLDDGRSRR